VCVTKLNAMNSRPLYVTFRRPITVMNKIRKSRRLLLNLEIVRLRLRIEWREVCFPISFENAYKMTFRPNMS